MTKEDSINLKSHNSNINYQVSNIPPLIVVVGETASGKTSAAIEIAKLIDGEIICADSRTIYKGMDIGTAKPNKEEQSGIRHHIIDVVEPGQKFNVSDFKTIAEKCIQDISLRGKISIIVGGTGLYIDSVLYNYQFLDKADTVLREQLEQMSDEQLTTILNNKSIDTTNLNTKNRRHVIRAIETNGKKPAKENLRENTIVLGLKLDKDVLKDRILKRVERMFIDGYLKEVEQLSKKFGWDSEAMSGIGYKAAKEYFCGNASLEDVKKALVKRDIGLAKRQRTWFKRSNDILWFEQPEQLVDRAIKFVNRPK